MSVSGAASQQTSLQLEGEKPAGLGREDLPGDPAQCETEDQDGSLSGQQVEPVSLQSELEPSLQAVALSLPHTAAHLLPPAPLHMVVTNLFCRSDVKIVKC